MLRVMKNNQESSKVVRSHQESSRDYPESSRVKHYKQYKASRALWLIKVERSNVFSVFSVLNQAFFKRFFFGTSKHQALVIIDFIVMMNYVSFSI